MLSNNNSTATNVDRQKFFSNKCRPTKILQQQMLSDDSSSATNFVRQFNSNKCRPTTILRQQMLTDLTIYSATTHRPTTFTQKQCQPPTKIISDSVDDDVFSDNLTVNNIRWQQTSSTEQDGELLFSDNKLSYFHCKDFFDIVLTWIGRELHENERIS